MVNLTVHKNTLEKRKRKDVREWLIRDAKHMAKNSAVSDKISGYAILAWSDDHESDTCWMSGNIPTQLIGEHFKQTMARKLAMEDARAIVRSELYGE